jgi:hypothetical protein
VEVADHFRRSAVTIGEGLMKDERLLREEKIVPRRAGKNGAKLDYGEEQKIPSYRGLTLEWFF